MVRVEASKYFVCYGRSIGVLGVISLTVDLGKITAKNMKEEKSKERK